MNIFRIASYTCDVSGGSGRPCRRGCSACMLAPQARSSVQSLSAQEEGGGSRRAPEQAPPLKWARLRSFMAFASLQPPEAGKGSAASSDARMAAAAAGALLDVGSAEGGATPGSGSGAGAAAISRKETVEGEKGGVGAPIAAASDTGVEGGSAGVEGMLRAEGKAACGEATARTDVALEIGAERVGQG
jgi:hypothetical protein